MNIKRLSVIINKLGILGKKFDWAGDDSLILPKKKQKNTEDRMIFKWFNMQQNFVSQKFHLE